MTAKSQIIAVMRRSLQVSISALVGMAIACGSSPPFNSYDPPPTFAIVYQASSPDVAAQWTGSTLAGDLVVDLVDSQFTTQGGRREFSGFVAFRSYLTVDDGRWPARWNIQSTAGCGKGTGGTVDVRTKIFTAYCTPQPRTVSLNPSDYVGSAPPSALQVSFDTSVVPPGTSVSLYIVDPTSQSVISSTDTTVDGSGGAQIGAPWLYSGYYYVLADTSSDENGSDVEFMVRDNPPGGLTLGPDASIGVNQAVTSSDGRFRLQYQDDGNLVLLDVTSDPWTTLWSSNTAGYSAGEVVMQSDGSLVVYDADWVARWSSGTGGNSYAYLVVQNDANMVVYNSIGTAALWATGTCCR